MTATTSTTRFEVLHALQVKGLAGDHVLAAMAGLASADLADAVAELVERGWAIRRDGRLSGTMITPAGRDQHRALLAENPLDSTAARSLSDFYAEFLPINSDFKRVCATWQVRPDGTPNDHADPEYDATVIAELAVIHDAIATALAPAASAVPRMGRYATRLDAALIRLRAGDHAAFARPMHDSYHDIWMELHQDLLLTTGRERGADDEK